MNDCPKCGGGISEVIEVSENDEGISTGDYGLCHVCKRAFRKCEVYSRVVGYLRPVSNWNKGKQEEFKQRKEYNIGDKYGKDKNRK